MFKAGIGLLQFKGREFKRRALVVHAGERKDEGEGWAYGQRERKGCGQWYGNENRDRRKSPLDTWKSPEASGRPHTGHNRRIVVIRMKFTLPRVGASPIVTAFILSWAIA
jgi:hypothetical protein